MSSQERREANLDAMAPALGRRLRAEVPDSRVGMDETGAATWTRFRRARPLSDDHCMHTVEHLPVEGPPLLLVGLGSGQRLAWLLEHTKRTVFTLLPHASSG